MGKEWIKKHYGRNPKNKHGYSDAQMAKFDRVGKAWIEENERKKAAEAAKEPFGPGGTEMNVPYDTDPLKYRFCDHPRPGSIITLPDIPELVRGPTVVLMPSGKEIQVPRMSKSEVQAPSNIHSNAAGQDKLQSLLKMLSGKQGPSAPSGFKMGRAPAFQLARNHPRQNPQIAAHGGLNLAY